MSAEKALQLDYEAAIGRVLDARAAKNVARAGARRFSLKEQNVSNIMQQATFDLEASGFERAEAEALREVASCLDALLRIRAVS